MFLYDKKDDTIDTYSIKADKDALIRYRRSILENIDINEIFYTVETNNFDIINRVITEQKLDITFLEPAWKSKNPSDYWLQFRQEKSSSEFKLGIYKEVLFKYICGEFSKLSLTRGFIPVEGLDDCIGSFLVTNNPASVYTSVDRKSYYRIENILNLPNELCTLQLLENGELLQLIATMLNYDEPLKCFSALEIIETNIEDIKIMFDSGLLQGTYKNFIDKVDAIQKVLKRLETIRKA